MSYRWGEERQEVKRVKKVKILGKVFVGLLVLLALVGIATAQEIDLDFDLNTQIHLSGSGTVAESLKAYDEVMASTVTAGINMQYDYMNEIDLDFAGKEMDNGGCRIESVSASYEKRILASGDVVSFEALTAVGEFYAQGVAVGDAEDASMSYAEFMGFSFPSGGWAEAIREYELTAGHVPEMLSAYESISIPTPDETETIKHLFSANAEMYGVYFESNVDYCTSLVNGNITVTVYDDVSLDIPATPIPDTGYNFNGTLSDYWAINNHSVKAVNIEGQFNGVDDEVPDGDLFYFADLSLQLQYPLEFGIIVDVGEQ